MDHRSFWGVILLISAILVFTFLAERSVVSHETATIISMEIDLTSAKGTPSKMMLVETNKGTFGINYYTYSAWSTYSKDKQLQVGEAYRFILEGNRIEALGLYRMISEYEIVKEAIE